MATEEYKYAFRFWIFELIDGGISHAFLLYDPIDLYEYIDVVNGYDTYEYAMNALQALPTEHKTRHFVIEFRANPCLFTYE